jgi:hypothetical protein
MKSAISLLLLTTLLFLATAAFAHHFFAGTYIKGQRISIEGTMLQFSFRNPHSFVQVETVNARTGEKTRWSAEWAANAQLVLLV